MKVEIPGIYEQDISVSIENNTLTVRGQRRFEKDEKEENFHRVEQNYGTCTRSFTLTNIVNHDQIDAHYDKGVLEIQLTSRAERQTQADQGERRKEDVGSQEHRQSGVIGVRHDVRQS